MTRLYLYDDGRARTFEPFATTRPVSEMVAGYTTIRERWTQALQIAEVATLAAPRHRDFDETGAPPPASGMIPAGSVIANSRCVPAVPRDARKRQQRARVASVWHCGARVAAIRLRDPVDASSFANGAMTLEQLAVSTGEFEQLRGWWHETVWDFVRLLPEQLLDDVQSLAADQKRAVPTEATILGDQPIVFLPTAGDTAPVVIEPHVVLDVTTGPIVLAPGVHVRAFTRLVGPCFVGSGSLIMGGDVNECSIGPRCKVRGEIARSIVAGFTNKGHDGFVGNSYLGQWVNLGAGTITSNLKNTYGTVNCWTVDGMQPTGMQFLGTLFGDHVKTGIGTRLTTGTVLGAGANVYGGGMPPKVVAPFSWGDAPPYSVYRLDKFLETAARVMARRDVALSDRAKRHLTTAHANRWTTEDS